MDIVRARHVTAVGLSSERTRGIINETESSVVFVSFLLSVMESMIQKQGENDAVE